MKNLLFVTMLILCFLSCEQDFLTEHLETGLEDYNRARPVGEKLINNIRLEKFAIFKTDKDTYSLVLKLNDTVYMEEIEKYHVALETILNDENKSLRDYEAEHNKKGFNFKPVLKKVNGHNYLINEIETKIKRFESIDIWFYMIENDVYKSVGGNRIQIRNLGL